jgi:hypothetical protein
MMNTPTKTIEITVDPEGGVAVKTKGFTGATCKDASRFIEQALGQAEREKLLPEYFQQVGTSNQIQQGN